MKPLLIFGGGGHGKVVADAAESSGWESVVFFDDRWPDLQHLDSWRVVGNRQELPGHLSGAGGVVVAVGDNRVRLSLMAEFQSMRAPLVSVIHNHASVSPHARIGVGSVLFASSAVNPGAVLGRGVIVNTGASIDHDCLLGDGVHVSPGVHLAGQVEVDEETWIGIGAVVREGIRIGRRCMVGAGSVVVDDVADGCKVMGVPARKVP